MQCAPRPPVLLVLLTASLASCVAPAPGGPETVSEVDRSAVQEQLFQMERDWVAAYETGDLSALDRLFADDFIYTLDDGTIHGKASFIALAEMDPVRYDSVRIEDMEIRWYGETPVITGVGVNYVTEDGQVVRTAGRFTNVFVERDAGWQVVVGHSTPLP